MSRHEKCNTCKSSVRHTENKPSDEPWWECRLRGPIPSPEDGTAWWPVVKPIYWCGDWAEPRVVTEQRAIHGAWPLCGRALGDNAILTCHAPRGHDGNCWSSR